MTTKGKGGHDRIGTLPLIALHLGPGIVFAVVFFLISGILTKQGFCSYLVLMIAIPVFLAPLEIGMIFLWSRRNAGTRSFRQAVGYLQKGNVFDDAVLPLILIPVGSALAFLAGPATHFLEQHLSGLFPMGAGMDAMIRDLASVSKTQQTIALILGLVCSGLVAPIVEELYFRGFLLSRSEGWGVMAPVFNSLLFGIYHMYAPWNTAAIFLMFLPIAYIAWARKDVRIGIVFHCLKNMINVIWLFNNLK